MRRGWLGLLGLFLWPMAAFGAPDTTMSITPSASAGTTILAADENTRNRKRTYPNGTKIRFRKKPAK